MIETTEVTSPVGRLRLAARDSRVCVLTFAEDWPRLRARVERRWPDESLRRAPDPAGLAYWVARLDGGEARSPVSASILVSTEGYQELARAVFQTFLRHQPDGAGLTFWTGELQSGLRDELLIASIIGSDEYLQYAAVHVP